MAPSNSPPIDASYECEAYRRQLPDWNFVDEVYRGDRSWLDYKRDGSVRPTSHTQRYLPKEEGESEKGYRNRVLRSHFSDRFANTVRDFVGVVMRNGIDLSDLPPEIAADWANLDGNGTDGNRLCAALALKSLRRGHTFVLIDYPQSDPDVVTHADSLNAGRQPQWTPIDPQQVINWRVSKVGGETRLTMAVIRSMMTLPDGDYGERKATLFTVYRPGRFDCYEQVIDKDKKTSLVYRPERSGPMGRQVNGRLVPFNYIPLVAIYSGDRTGFFESNPTLFSLAQLNVTHYQVQSDHRTKMRYCSFPVPVRKGGDGSDLTIGPNSLIDVDVGGSFDWAEPSSRSLDASRQEIEDILRQMELLSSDYLSTARDRQAARTSELQATKFETELFLFASDFAFGLTRALKYHAAYRGMSFGGEAKLDIDFFRDMSKDPQMLLALNQLQERGTLERDEVRAYIFNNKLLEKNDGFD